MDARLRARDQAIAELELISHQIEQVQNVASLVDGDNRLRSIKATFPNENRIQALCSELGGTLSQLREEHDLRISLLTSLANSVNSTPTGELKTTLQQARELGAGFTDDARIGVLLQQIESSVSTRLERQAAHARDLEALFADVSRSRSLQELARIVDRSRTIAALDRSDEDLAARARDLQSDAAHLRTSLESLLTEMSSLAGNVTAAPTIDDAEAIIPKVRSLAERHPDFQELQEAATRLLAQIHGRRIEHDLIVQELESTHATLAALEAEDDLSAATARASECRVLHRNDPTILALSAEIETTVERILQERAELRERTAACDAAIDAADQQLLATNPNGALETLLAAEPGNPDRADLHQKIAAVQKQVEQLRIKQEGIGRERTEAELSRQRAEQQREEPERIAREKAEQERLAKQKAEAEGRERERLEQEQIAAEKADAEAHARRAATDKAIQQARQMLAEGSAEESLTILLDAIKCDPASPALNVALEATRQDIARQKAERERVARTEADNERAGKDRLAKEKVATNSGDPRPATHGTPASSSSEANLGPVEITSAALDKAAHALAVFLGPIAAVLARKEAKRATSLQNLHERLAEHITDPPERKRFLSSVDKK